MKRYLQLIITSKEQHAEKIADLLTELNALSVSFVDAGDEPLFQLDPFDLPLWQQTKMLALFPEDINVEAIINLVKHYFPEELTFDIKKIKDEDWVRKAQTNFPAQCYSNNLWVVPSWCDTNAYEGTVMTIEPGLAFGTGTHPTTALCLEWLATHPLKNQSVIDYGCGSGILAIAALSLGAQAVYAIDHDEQALLSTKNNAELNPAIKNKLIILSNNSEIPVKASLILANILSGPLITLAPIIKNLATKDATLVLSGLLTNEIESVAKAYLPEFTLHLQKTKGEWALLVMHRKCHSK